MGYFLVWGKIMDLMYELVEHPAFYYTYTSFQPSKISKNNELLSNKEVINNQTVDGIIPLEDHWNKNIDVKRNYVKN